MLKRRTFRSVLLEHIHHVTRGNRPNVFSSLGPNGTNLRLPHLARQAMFERGLKLVPLVLASLIFLTDTLNMQSKAFPIIGIEHQRAVGHAFDMARLGQADIVG